jgi:hypothetical protein
MRFIVSILILLSLSNLCIFEKVSISEGEDLGKMVCKRKGGIIAGNYQFQNNESGHIFV